MEATCSRGGEERITSAGVIQSEAIPEVSSPLPNKTPSVSVWGLCARELHDAYWHSKGVQCVRRGQRQRLQKGAELFLLLEPDQFVLFDIVHMSERLMWRNAVVTRLRLIHEGKERYFEHVVTDDEGYVQRIERRYRPREEGSSRVVLSTSRRIAGVWMHAKSRHHGWDRVRRAVPWPRVDHGKCAGSIFLADDPDQQRQLIDRLVEFWPYPDQAISGLGRIDSNIWHVAGEPLTNGVIRIGPLWLGRGAGRNAHANGRCLVGPAWIGDQSAPDGEPNRMATMKDIIDIDLPELIAGGSAALGHLYPGLKRAFDLVASFLALVMLSPIFLLFMLSIYLEDGRPLYFGHIRQGRGGRLFRCWKFRTMHRDAEKDAREIEANVCDGPQVYIPDDPRVTRMGRFLRATNLDELPQLWNVLVGEMSLVGPRPSPDDENQYCPAWRDLRLSVRPGITGLWQLYRTREPGEDFQEWIKYDIEYVQSATFWLDLVILAKTVVLFVSRRSTRAT